MWGGENGNQGEMVLYYLQMYLLFIWTRDVMIFIVANPLRGPLEGEWALKKIETFLGPEMTTREANAIWAQKSGDFQGPPLPLALPLPLPSLPLPRPVYIEQFRYQQRCVRYVSGT